MRAGLLILVVLTTLTGCGSLLESTIAAPQAYVLRLPPRTGPAAAAPSSGSVRVQRPQAGPGLESNRIALLRSDQRFDFYAAALWAAPASELIESVLLERLRGSGMFSVVLDDSAPYLPHYELRCGLSRFESDYTAGSGAPTAQVVLDCTLGRHRDRALLRNFTARGSARASEDRLGDVVAAFESATLAAMTELETQVGEALAAEGTGDATG